MTTQVTVKACCSSEKQVELKITEGESLVEQLILNDGDEAERFVYDDRVISVKETLKERQNP